ncbi:MAG: alpha/beta fold hydrolase [Candidatus Flexifilum sp.]
MPLRSAISILSTMVFFAVMSALPVKAQIGPALSDLLDTAGEPCPNDSLFTCVTLEVPLDHTRSDESGRIPVTFAVLPAAVESRGVFVIVTGGPGSSGIALADAYTDPMQQPIRDYFDIVFFDQRGAGLSGGLTCPLAAAAYYADPGHPYSSEGEARLIPAARQFAADCQAEMEAADLLPYLGTEQAVHDLEIFRQRIGAPRIWLYGESYGTQFAQTYAAAYPDALDGLILDGVVDLTLDLETFYREQAAAFRRALDATFAACDAQPECAAFFDGDSGAFYDALAAELIAAPLVTGVVHADGTPAAPLTLADLERAAVDAVYSREGRAYFLRVLALAAAGIPEPLHRLALILLGYDPYTLELTPDPSWSDGLYYGIECSDYAVFPGATDPAAAFIEAGRASGAAGERLGSIFFTDLPCAFWGHSGPETRPAPLTPGDYPVLILNADIDPATPVNNGYDVFDRLIAAGADAFMITMLGGPHVLFGRYEACPDDAVTALMVDGIAPEARESICLGDALAPIDMPILAPEDAVELALAFDQELVYAPEYQYWDGAEPLTVQCNAGGVWTLTPEADGSTAYAFDNCAQVTGYVMDGQGGADAAGRRFFTVTVTGLRAGELMFSYDPAAERYSLSGTLDGQPVSVGRP